MFSLYEKRSIDANGRRLGMVHHQGIHGCADLAAIYNMVTLKYSSVYGREGSVTENFLKSIISDMLETKISRIEDISNAQEREIKKVLSNIRSDFSMQPRLSGHMDFVSNASYFLCRILDLSVIHGWVLDPKVSSYGALSTFSHEELMKYTSDLGQNDQICNDLLADYKDQLTPYGFASLAAEINDDGIALLLWRSTLHLVHKHCGVIYTYVADEDIRRKMPEAIWMLFEEYQQRNLYFTDKYIPVKGQPCEKEAREWYFKFLQTLKEKDGSQKKDGKKDESQTKDGKKDENQKNKNAERNRAKKEARKKKLSQQVQSHVVTLESSEHEGEDADEENSSSGELTLVDDKTAAAATPEIDNVSEVSDELKRGDDKTTAAAEAATPEIDNVPEVSDELTLGDDKAAAAADNVPKVPEGVASEFFKFLIDFRDDGCPYFKGIVAAFPSHCPLFYVPYDFIMAHNETLALKIQDNYTRISEDLNKAVVAYFSKNEVVVNDVVLKIIGLPEPKSVQSFEDFIDSIVLHEHYVVYGADPEALPSYDSRRMALGYIGCIVAKFRTGRCWAGEWSALNMKVKNKGLEFVIDFKKDYELKADRAFLDLTKFCETVLERLKFNGRSPPYFDELQDDMMLINECIGNPEKWERFLQLISNPLALKPPLVRASFLCDVYLVGHANSSGDPPRYGPLFKDEGCSDWRPSAKSNQLFKKVYAYQYDLRRKKLKHIIDNWAPKHWHVFKFSRHFIHHVLELTKGKDWIQKVNDISEIDILLSRTIWKAIAKSVRFLVLNCGVNGVFSSAWRHYIGSDYMDKGNGNLEDTTIAMVKDLVDSISVEKISGYLYTEVSAYSEPEYKSIITSNADLTEFQTKLNENGFKFEVADAGRTLRCGSILIWKRIYEEDEEGSRLPPAIVVEGPYSTQYEAVYVFLTGWLGLVSDDLEGK